MIAYVPGVALGLIAACGALVAGLVTVRFHYRLQAVFLAALGFVLAGYALLGRSFAYLGAPPMLIGELVFAFGLVAAAASGSVSVLRASPVISALFVGRLSPEKGLHTLLDAVRRLPDPPLLKSVGDGPLMPADRYGNPAVVWLGHQSRASVVELMQTASLLIMPSEWYEMSPLTLIEAFATGAPIIATRLGTMGETVTDGVTGLLYTPRDAADLARTIGWAQSHPGEMQEMARRARTEFEGKYTPERHYERLIEIYREAIDERMHQGVQPAARSSRRRDLPCADPADKRAGATPG
jgi:glycosyltransferase involved in cell wall biosynthesis